jgi:hypothetical protein
VLIVPAQHTGSMVAFFILIAVIVLCVLAAAFGVDSRFDRPGRQF